jgi:uncharacterized protein with PIN domain
VKILLETAEFEVPKMDLRLGGVLARGLRIAGISTVHWSIQADDDSMLTIQTKAYYIPEVKHRLLSPQQSLFKERIGVSPGGIELESSNRFSRLMGGANAEANRLLSSWQPVTDNEWHQCLGGLICDLS